MRRLLPLLTLLSPSLALAQVNTTSQIAGLFNIFVGLLLTVAMLTYAVGLIMWFVRLGTWPTYRTEAIKIMEWSVAQLFVLVVLLAIVQFFQRHPQAAMYVLSFIVVVGIIAMAIYIASHSGEEKEEH